MFVGHLAGEIHNIGRPPDSRHAVRERFVNHGIERLEKTARRLIVVTHAALFAHHVAFGIELAQDGVLHTVGFKPHEQFNLVLRERHDIGRHEVARESVQARTARRLVGAPQFILHKNLAVFVHHGIVFGGQLFHRQRITRQFRRTD